MSEHKIRVDVELDTSEAQKKLDSLAKEKRKINVDVDSSDIDEASKKADNLKNKNIRVDAKVMGKETIDSTAKSLDKATKSASRFGNSIKSFAKFGGYLEVFQLIKRGAQEAVQAIKEIDDAIVDLQMATGDSYENVRQLVSGYNQLAQTLGATTTEISKGADTWLRQGKSISETNQLLQDTMVLSKVAQIDSDDSSSYLTAIMKGYKMAADEVAGINDSLTSIDLAAAVDAAGLAEATSRVAASADLAGVSLNRLLGYAAAIGEASQESMSVIGNSLKTIFTRMANIKAGNLELIDEDGTTQSLSDVETVLNNVGIKLRDSTNEFRDFDTVLDETAAKWQNLSSVQQAAVAQAFSGTFQRNRFQLLMENYDKALQYEQIAESSSGTAMAKFEDGYLNSIEAKTKSLQAAFEGLSSNLISRDTINGILEATQALVEFLDKTSLVKGALAGLAAGAVIKGFSLISAGIAKATVGIMSFGDAAKKAFSALKANPIATVSTVIGLATAAWSAYNQAVEESIQRAKDITSAWDESNSSLNEQISKYKELKSQLDSGTLTPDEDYSTRQQILDIQTQITSQYGEQAEGVSLVNGNLEQQLAILQQIAAENAKTELNKGMDEYKNVSRQMEKERSYLVGATSFIGENAYAKDIYDLAKEYEELGISIKDVSEAAGQQEGTSFEIYFDGDATQADKVVSDFMNRVSELKDKYRDDIGAISFIDDSNYYAADALKENQKVLDDYQESYNRFLEMDMLSRGIGEGSVADVYNKYTEAVQNYNEALASGDSSEINKTRSEFQKLGEEVDSVLKKDDNAKFASLFDGVEETLDEAAIKLNDFNEALQGKAGNYNTFKDTADDIKAASDGLKGLNLDVQEVRNALITDGVQTGEEQILALADAWGVAADSSEEEINEFLSVLEEAGIITGQVGSAAEAAAASYDTFSSAVTNAKDDLSALQSIMSESASGAGISADNVQAFRDMFGDDAEKALEKTANGYHLNVDALRDLQKQQETLTKSDYLTALSDQYELLYENAEQLARAQFLGEDTSGLESTRQGILDQISSLEDLKLQYEATTSAYQDWINAQSNGNERDMYDNIQSGYDTVTDLIERGWGGSDEVRTYVDLLSSADLSTASVEEVIDAYDRLGKTIGNSGYSILDFFTVDEDGNTTTDGIYNFFDTVNSVLGEEYAKLEDGQYTFDFGDGRDQIVADKLGMDVEAVQSILRAASEAGFEVNLDQPIASMEELKTSAQSAQEALANMKDTSLGDINLESTSFTEITDDIAQVENYIDEISDSDLDPEVKTEKLENANAILEYLVQLQNEAGNNSIEINISEEELDQKISDAKAALDELRNEDGSITINDNTEEAITNLQTLLMQKEQLNSPAVMAVDTSKVDGELGDVLSKIQEYQSAVQELSVQNELKLQGVSIDTSAAQEKVNTLAEEIRGINPDITAKLNIDTTSVQTINASLQGMTPEILVKAGVDSTAIANYTPAEKESKVRFKVDSSAVDAWDPPDKTAKLEYTITTIGTLPGNRERTLTYNIRTNGNVPEVNGTAHANGSTVKSYRFNNWHGQANASGNWGIREGGTSLVGELGQEILVRGSEFHTIGDNGAEFIQTRPGDIIFNHKQTEALLKNGYVTSRGKMIGSNANVNGSAYSSGSGGLGRPSRPSYGMDDSYAFNSSSQKSSAEKSADKASKSAEKAADKFEEIVDSIEILLDRMDRNIQKLTDSIETYSYDLSKQSAASDKAMSTIRSNLTTLQSAYNRYIKEANSVGLSSSWKKRVQNGAIDITTITDENLADKIKNYENWYTKALDVQDTIADYQSQLLDLATEKLDNIEQYFENRTNYNDEFGYLTDISTLQNAVNKLTAELDKQVASGVIKEGSNEWYEAMSKIAEMQDALLEATLKKYQDIIDNLDRISTTLDNSLTLKEARGDTITEQDYQRPLEVTNEQIDELYKKREKLLKQQGIYDVGSAKYDDYAEQIADIDDEIYGLLGDIEDLKDKIWEVRWEPFFDGMEAAENLRNEMDEIRGLLADEAFIGSDGGLTSDGLANLALISSAMNVEKQRIRDFQEAISKLNEDLDVGNISTSEYEEQLSSFLSEIRSGVSAVNDYEDEILSLHEEMLQAENDIIQNSIEKYQKLNNERQKSDSYARNIRNQTKEINQIEAQLSALSGVTNESALRQKKLLEAQLAELQDELDQTQQDHAYDVRDQGYQNLSDSLNEQLNDTLDNIKYNSSEQERVISEMLDHIVNNYADAYDKINQIISDTGLVPSDGFQQVIDNIGNQQGAQNQVNDSNTIAPDYDPSDFTNINTGGIQSGSNQANNDKIQSEIEKEPNIDNRPVAQITLKPTSLSLQEGKSSTVKATIRPTDAANKSVKWSSSNTKVATVSNGVVKAVKAGSARITCTAQDGSGISASCSVTVTAKPKASKPSASTSGGDGKPRVGDRVTLSGWYYYDSYGKSPAGNRYSGVKNGVIIDAYSAKKYGGNGRNTGGYDVHIRSADGKYGNLGWVKLSQLKGYAGGTTRVGSSQLAWTQEEGAEIIVSPSTGAMLTPLKLGDGVIPHNLTKNLMEWGALDPEIVKKCLVSMNATIANDCISQTVRNITADSQKAARDMMSSVGKMQSENQRPIVVHYDSLLTVNGDIDKEVFPGVKKMCEEACRYTAKEFQKDSRLMGITRTL